VEDDEEITGLRNAEKEQKERTKNLGTRLLICFSDIIGSMCLFIIDAHKACNIKMLCFKPKKKRGPILMFKPMNLTFHFMISAKVIFVEKLLRNYQYLISWTCPVVYA
jgi:hypothetical protein